MARSKLVHGLCTFNGLYRLADRYAKGVADVMPHGLAQPTYLPTYFCFSHSHSHSHSHCFIQCLYINLMAPYTKLTVAKLW